MTGYERYKRNVIIKAFVIPAIAVLIFSGFLYTALPHIQNRLPNGVAYSLENNEVTDNA